MGQTSVLAAVIEHGGSYLVCQRPAHKRHGGLWEFPGGKIGAHETHGGALTREIREELGVDIEVGELIYETVHHYPDRSVALYFYRCRLLGAPRALLGQEMRWIPRSELASLSLPPADAELIDLLTHSGG